ncbi:hypothetical protein PUN28_008092 [Cardiocondyla obscurior]|uniref:Uncharacterized protein n=1 Tax=Cardiocondyla obscurior TaxID=286306 RepID=A0AAW2FYM7_9HYME
MSSETSIQSERKNTCTRPHAVYRCSRESRTNEGKYAIFMTRLLHGVLAQIFTRPRSRQQDRNNDLFLNGTLVPERKLMTL